MQLSKHFWGEQGRIGHIRSGEWVGRYVFVTPDTVPGSWIYVIEPSPYPRVPGDDYVLGLKVMSDLIDEWGVEWIPNGPEEVELERRIFGWRPLLGPDITWLPDFEVS